MSENYKGDFMKAAIYTSEIICKDPETGEDVYVELYKDPTANAMFGIEASFLEQCSSEDGTAEVPSMYNPKEMLLIDAKE